MLTETGTSSRSLGGLWSILWSGLRKIPHFIGLDRAIAFTVLGRVIQGLGSVGTVLLIVHYLTAEQQGYYYTLWSLVALESVFELGFSFVILQIAAHERAHLHFQSDGSITGSAVAHYRLASALQRAVRWYTSASLVMGAVLLVGGMHFFSLRHEAGLQAPWVWPLRMTVAACAITFAVGPVLSFLEGCGQVSSVARMRFFQSMVSTGAAWIAMFSHHGLYAPAMVLMGQGASGMVLVYSRRALLLPLMRLRVGNLGISWRREVWPFQWKIAVSWLCDYFIFQLFTPVLFAFKGPVEAGRMGLSMSVVTQLSAIMLAWMTTKAAPFGSMIARKEIGKLDSLFFRSLRQSLSLFAASGFLLLVGVIIAPLLMPRLSQRV
ncbi:MAG: hypothetical protein WB608_19970, partial [Terracidiphilus sp.]